MRQNPAARPLLLALIAALATVSMGGGCRSRTPDDVQPTDVVPVSTIIDPARAEAAPQVTPHPVRFTDVTADAGVRWTYHNGATGRHLFVETTGGGIAFFDYDNDGLLDIVAIQSGPVPGAKETEKRFSTRNALYRNRGDGTFVDVTAGSGLDAYTGYGQAVAVGDYDNDGWSDLYVTAYGGNHLFRNNGGKGTFTDVTRRAGVSGTAEEMPWPLSAAWGDYDNDGHLDLFVTHYVRWSPALDKPCPSVDGSPSYCRPQVYEPSRSRLYRNNGDGTFRDVTQRAGLDRLRGKAMGVVWLDYDGDDRLDLFVTNDTMPNFLLRNNDDGTFTDRAILAGVAFGDQGESLSGMGIGRGDYDNDGREDLFVVNFSGQPKSVYRNAGGGLFESLSYRTNVASTNLQFLGFGLECLDYDLDGYKDLVVGNGHVLDHMDTATAGSSYEQSQQLLHNQRDGTFADDQRSLGDLVKPRVTRGLAVGDYDNDGDEDVLMVSQTGPLQLYRNDGGNRNHWINLRLEGVRGSRDAVGAKVTLRAGTLRQTQWVRGGSSYCSYSDTRLTFGLGDRARVEGLEIRWPGGRIQKLGPLAADRFYRIREGAAPVPAPEQPPLDSGPPD